MGRGAQSPSPAPLPKVQFRKVEDANNQPAGVHDLQARSFGYNDGSDFERPVRYIKHIEPLDTDLDKQVEYDMDEQDQDWLDHVNAERQKEQMGKITYETFEVIMDRLEKEWFGLTKNIPQPDYALPSEDSTCAICDDSEGENMNAIVFCDGCNLAVHQDCYGVPYIPEGQWLCRKCTVSPESTVSCVLCPNEGGAFKQTVTGEWVHLLCAIWVPETRVANDVFMEPVNGVDRIPKQRWKLRCSVCGIREGACIQCAKASCYEAFHVTCARREKFLMPMKSVDGQEATLSCYCERHLPSEQQQVRAAALADREDDSEHGLVAGRRSAKTARAYAKSYASGPPLVPAIIVERVMQYIGKVSVRKKHEFVILVCKYWSLKREARRGAPLLKRLHLEPWTATSGSKQQSDEDKAMKLEQLKRLRVDLERVRTLNDLVRQREALKLRQAELTNSVLSNVLYPYESEMRAVFDRVCQYDHKDFFKNPVSRAAVPDYFEVIKRPMCWNTIRGKLDRHEYWNVHALRDDVQLVLDNAVRYNKSDTSFYKTAYRLRALLPRNFTDLEQRYPLRAPAIVHNDRSSDVETRQTNGIVEDDDTILGLEPPLALLDLLTKESAVADDTDLILDVEPVTSLFNFEHAVLKPPPPPPTPPPPPPPKKKKEARERPKKKLPRETITMLDAAPGFRATRRGAARAAAFEAEANARPSAVRSPDSSLGLMEPSASTVASDKGKRKRTQTRSSEKSDMPPLVEDVDSQRSFKMFDKGWILPDNTKRRGRVEREVPTPPAPPPKKAAQPKRPARTPRSRQKSLLSESTHVSENQTLPVEPPPTTDEDEAVSSQEDLSRLSSLTPAPEEVDSMDVEEEDTANLKEEEDAVVVDDMPENEKQGTAQGDEDVNLTSEAVAEVVSSLSEFATKDHNSVEALADMARALEESPAIPEQSSGASEEQATVTEPMGQRKGPQKRKLPVIDVVETPATRRERRVQLAAHRAAKAGREDTESASAGPSRVKPSRARPRVGATTAPVGGLVEATTEGDRDVSVDDGFEPGTLVWAKVSRFPFWPAVVVDPQDQQVPWDVTDQRPAQAEGPVFLVHFFDKSSSWGWVREKEIDLLGEDEAVDGKYLARKGFKDKKTRNECERFYQKALATVETASDVKLTGKENVEDKDGADGTPVGGDNHSGHGDVATAEEAMLDVPPNVSAPLADMQGTGSSSAGRGELADDAMDVEA